MPVSEKSIVAVDEVDSKAPIKKKTVVWGLVIAVLAIMLAYYVPRLISPPKKAEPPKAAPEKTSSQDEERARQRQIEEEMAASRAQAEREAAERAKDLARREASAQAENSGQPAPQPIGGVSSTGGYGSGAGGAAGDPRADALAAEAEKDAASRTSKSLAFDSSSESRGRVDSQQRPGVRDPGPESRQLESQEEPALSAQERLLSRFAAASQSANEPDQANKRFLRDVSESSSRSKAIFQKPGTKNPVIHQGKVIPAVLQKNLNSDLPGDITAITTMDVYDSLSGQRLLIPKGSVLVGEYNNSLRTGQSRVLFAFSRIILTDGTSFDLPSNKGQDAMGASGVTGDVNTHFFKRFTNALLVALLADRVERNITSAPASPGGAPSSGARSAAGQVLVDIAKADLDKTKDIPPTITVDAGTRINVQVAADMEFPEYKR